MPLNAPTVNTVRGSQGEPSYTQVDITGDMDGTTVMTATADIPLPTIRGGYQLLVTGDINTAVLTASVFDSGLGFADAEEDLVRRSDTVGADLRAEVQIDLFEAVLLANKPGFVLPPTTVTFRLVSGNVSSNGTVKLRAVFLHA